MNKNKQAGYRLCTLTEEQDISAAASGEDDKKRAVYREQIKKLLESASEAWT